MPLEKMARWLEKESAGFGEGKTYDTMAEEQLLEEMEQSREAQLAKIINLKNQFKSAAIARSKMQESHHRGGIEPLVFFFFLALILIRLVAYLSIIEVFIKLLILWPLFQLELIQSYYQ